MPPVQSDVRIDRALPAVRTYLGHVPNLVHWTTFFRSVGTERDGRYEVDSIAGPIVTWIETETLGDASVRQAICSLIKGRVERATLDLLAGSGGVDVRFEVHLPREADDEALAEQRAEMRRELDTLKALVEGDDGDR
jgi:hypothetical protein